MARKKKATRGISDKGTGPDCTTCDERQTCPRYAENSFCGKWHREPPEKQGEDPNDLWRRGEPVDF